MPHPSGTPYVLLEHVPFTCRDCGNGARPADGASGEPQIPLHETRIMKYDAASARALMGRTPSVLRAMLLDLPAEWLDAPERPGAWSARDVACHMADLERDAWLPRVRWILEHGAEGPMPGIERERFRTRYADSLLPEVLDDFQEAREANLRELDALELDEGALESRGSHQVLGDVRLSHLLSTWVVHDLTHLAQIQRALAAQYREAVGPWSDFLSVLREREGGR